MTFHRTHLRQLSGAVFAALLATMPVACGQTYSPYSPSYSQPSYSQPTYSQPNYGQPTYGQPTYSQPTYSQSTPAYSAPNYGSNPAAYQVPENSQPSANTSPGYTWETPAPAPQVQTLTAAQVGDLTSSIALYPDPLLAAMLPAATYPDQIASAQQWLATTPRPDETSIQNLPFEAPIKTLLHYPDVLQLMASHLDWTQALGAAFLYQPNDVMNSIQHWRSMAQAQGYLQTTAQQDIISNGPIIEILPPTPQMVYIPVYDPGVVFGPPRVYNRPVIDYRACGAGGGWLDYGLDWHDREVLMPTRPYWERRDRDNRWYDDYRRQAFYDRDRGDWNHNDNNRVIVQPQRRDGNRPAVAALPPPAPPQIERRAFVRDSLKPGVVYPQRIVTPTEQKVITPPPPQRLSDAQRAAQQQQAAQQAAAQQQAAQQATAKQTAAQRLQQQQAAQNQQAAQQAAAQQAAQKQAEQQAALQRAQQQQAAQQAAQKQAEQPTAAQRALQLKLTQQAAGQKAAEQQAAAQRAQQQLAAQQAAQQAAAQQAARQQRERDAAAAQQAAAQQAAAQHAQQQAAEQQAAARQAAAQKAAADQQAAARQAAAQQAAAQQQAAQREVAVRQATAQQAAAQQAAAQQAAARKAEEDRAAQQARGRNTLSNGLPVPPGRARGQDTDPNIDNR